MNRQSATGDDWWRLLPAGASAVLVVAFVGTMNPTSGDTSI
jgi:hypothetical protein